MVSNQQQQHPQQHCAGSSQLTRMQACVHSLLLSIQEDPSRQGLLDTPKRVAKAMLDMTEGYREDPAQLLNKALFDEPDIQEGAGGLVLVRDIDFAALSQDNLLPFYGRCHIAYVPANGIVLGLSKLARLTKLCAKQLHTQDGLARQLLHYLQKQLQPLGAVVVVEARHLDYTAQQPPLVQLSAAASGCFAAEAATGTKGFAHNTIATNNSTNSSSATLEEVLELMGSSLEPRDVQLVQDAANPLCLLRPSCNCSKRLSSSSSAAHRVAVSQHSSCASLPPSSSSLQLSATPACSACGSSRLAPHVLRGMSASAGGLDSPRAPVTPDPSENNSDTDGSEQGSDLYCASLLLGISSSSDVPVQLSTVETADPTASSRRHAAAAAAGVAAAFAGTSPAAGTPDLPAVQQEQEQEQQEQQDEQQLCGTVSMEAALLQLLAEAGIDVAAPGVQAAARRHVLSLLAATSGYQQEQPSRPALQLPSGSQHQHHQQLVPGQQQATVHHNYLQQQQQQLPQYKQFEHTVSFMSQCEHHMLPFHGTLHIQYMLPEGSSSRPVQPLSQEEAVQLVQCYTKRLQVQERITQQVAAAVQRLLQPAGVMVVVQAVHMCMVARGVENHAGSTTTRAALGMYESDTQLRCKFLRHLREQQQEQQQQRQAPRSHQHQQKCQCAADC